jgi:FkbM family methyltransferase
MISIQYTSEISYSFPSYNECDAGWFSSAEISTKKFIHSYVKPEFNIIDAGANIGMYTIPFSKLASKGTVYAFEPTDIVDMLEKNLAYNDCKENVILINRPLGKEDGLKLDKIFKVWSQGITDDREHDFITLNSFVEQIGKKIDLIKIDVDSYDYEVLLGGEKFLREQSPLIIIELNHALEKRGHTIQDAKNYLESIGYFEKEVFDGENYIFTK